MTVGFGRVRRRLELLVSPAVRTIREKLQNTFLQVDGKIFLRVPAHIAIRHLEVAGLHASRLQNLVVWFPLTVPIEIAPSASTLMSGQPQGRLGNRIFEMAIGLHVAALTGLERFAIVHRPEGLEEEIFLRGLRSANAVGLTKVAPNGLRSEGGSEPLRGRLIIQADFLNSFPEALSRPDNLASSFDALRKSGFLTPSRHSRTQMVLHVRGTDRLSAPSSQQYRLVPNSFYLQACRLENVSQVTIVTDDSDSAVVLALVEQLKKIGVGAAVQSKSLEEDVRTLMSARVLALAGSSLSDSIAGLTSRAQRIYLYQKRMWVRKQMAITEIYDASGLYDRELMAIDQNFETRAVSLVVSFPENRLRFRKI